MTGELTAAGGSGNRHPRQHPAGGRGRSVEGVMPGLLRTSMRRRYRPDTRLRVPDRWSEFVDACAGPKNRLRHESWTIAASGLFSYLNLCSARNRWNTRTTVAIETRTVRHWSVVHEFSSSMSIYASRGRLTRCTTGVALGSSFRYHRRKRSNGERWPCSSCG